MFIIYECTLLFSIDSKLEICWDNFVRLILLGLIADQKQKIINIRFKKWYQQVYLVIHFWYHC